MSAEADGSVIATATRVGRDVRAAPHPSAATAQPGGPRRPDPVRAENRHLPVLVRPNAGELRLWCGRQAPSVACLFLLLLIWVDGGGDLGYPHVLAGFAGRVLVPAA